MMETSLTTITAQIRASHSRVHHWDKHLLEPAAPPHRLVSFVSVSGAMAHGTDRILLATMLRVASANPRSAVLCSPMELLNV